MSKEKRIQLILNQKVRICWYEEHETVTNYHQLKIKAAKKIRLEIERQTGEALVSAGDFEKMI